MNWAIVIAALILAGYLLDREIYFYEGVHLGPRVQAWLYDRWSKKYDEGKRESQLQDDEMLAQPLLEALRGVPTPFLLDFATGTGRLSAALTSRPEFAGHIIALDLSLGMLERAAEKLAGRAAEIEFLRHQTLPLPFPDESFDVVCALEVLELFPSMDEPLAELARVLRPGGLLLTSRGTEASGRRAKVKSEAAFRSVLEANGFEAVQITKWWKLFDRALAVKAGRSAPVPHRSLRDVLKCPVCGGVDWQGWSCRCCGKALTVTSGGIVVL